MQPSPQGAWAPGPVPPAFDGHALASAIARPRELAHLVREGPSGRIGVGFGGEAGPARDGRNDFALVATLPPIYPEWLGDRSFGEAHGVRFPYVAGEMANGIATTRLVVAMARAQMLGFFGAAGLSPDRVARAIDEIESELGAAGNGAQVPAWGSNLIHSPNEPDIEDAVCDLYLRREVRRVSASAFLALTPAVVRYAASGLAPHPSGAVRRKNLLFAKISRPEVARPFLSPAPQEILDALVAKGLLSAAEAALARRVPVAEDVTVEADSGGHTDNRPLAALLPIVLRLADDLSREHGYLRPIRVGAGGGIGTPTAVASAFALGAAYVLTGSINQSAVESGLSPEGKLLLTRAGVADVVMAPAADMFEMGVKVQVLKLGTMFGPRALRLYQLYTGYDGIDAMPPEVKARLEREILGLSCEEVWKRTRAFFVERDPHEVERAESDPKHQMALIFRWYLGLTSKWAISGDPERKLDYQIWCGPAMGAFNDWVRGSFLEPPEARTVVQIARNLLEGAAVVTRAQQLRSYGVAVPPEAFRFEPRPLD